MNATSSASVQYDLVVRNAALPDGREGVDIAVRDGRIAAVAPRAELAAARGAVTRARHGVESVRRGIPMGVRVVDARGTAVFAVGQPIAVSPNLQGT